MNQKALFYKIIMSLSFHPLIIHLSSLSSFWISAVCSIGVAFLALFPLFLGRLPDDDDQEDENDADEDGDDNFDTMC